MNDDRDQASINRAEDLKRCLTVMEARATRATVLEVSGELVVSTGTTVEFIPAILPGSMATYKLRIRMKAVEPDFPEMSGSRRRNVAFTLQRMQEGCDHLIALGEGMKAELHRLEQSVLQDGEEATRG
jgi:hypothetical protein